MGSRRAISPHFQAKPRIAGSDTAGTDIERCPRPAKLLQTRRIAAPAPRPVEPEILTNLAALTPYAKCYTKALQGRSFAECEELSVGLQIAEVLRRGLKCKVIP